MKILQFVLTASSLCLGCFPEPPPQAPAAKVIRVAGLEPSLDVGVGGHGYARPQAQPEVGPGTCGAMNQSGYPIQLGQTVYHQGAGLVQGGGQLIPALVHSVDQDLWSSHPGRGCHSQLTAAGTVEPQAPLLDPVGHGHA